MTAEPPVILLAAGGTGGHLFPAEALANELVQNGVIIHLATDHRGMAYGGTFPARARHQIRAATPSGNSPLAFIKALVILARGFWQSYRLIRAIKPVAVVGFGGYPSVPPVLAAAFAGVPTIIHEQNGVLGRANRFVGHFVKAIATGFDHPKHLSPYLAQKAHHVGNPIRPQVREAMTIPYPSLDDDAEFHLLVTGGSQGARIMSEVVPQALAAMPETLRRRLHVTHQARGDDLALAERLYQTAGIAADIRAFFDDLPMRIARSHLVIGRAGASTLAELTAIGRPSILVPLPGSLDQDQAANAESLARCGAAIVVKQSDFTAERVAPCLAHLMTSPRELTDSSRAAKSAGIADGATRLAQLIGQVTGQNFSKGTGS